MAGCKNQLVEETIKASTNVSLPSDVVELGECNNSSPHPGPDERLPADVNTAQGSDSLERMRQAQNATFMLNYPELYASRFNTSKAAYQSRVIGTPSSYGRGRRPSYRKLS